MKLREIMSNPVIWVHPEESVSVAARLLTHYNIGAMPVCGSDGRVWGLVTDRDIVTRCLAAGRSPQTTVVREIMTNKVIAVRPDMDTTAAAAVMGREQVRRLPVVEGGRLCGMVSIGDLARREDTNPDAADALGDICTNISVR